MLITTMQPDCGREWVAACFKKRRFGAFASFGAADRRKESSRLAPALAAAFGVLDVRFDWPGLLPAEPLTLRPRRRSTRAETSALDSMLSARSARCTASSTWPNA